MGLRSVLVLWAVLICVSPPADLLAASCSAVNHDSDLYAPSRKNRKANQTSCAVCGKIVRCSESCLLCTETYFLERCCGVFTPAEGAPSEAGIGPIITCVTPHRELLAPLSENPYIMVTSWPAIAALQRSSFPSCSWITKGSGEDAAERCAFERGYFLPWGEWALRFGCVSAVDFNSHQRRRQYPPLLRIRVR